MVQDSFQLNGTDAHKYSDSATYSTKKGVLQGISVYCEKYNLVGKIDVFDEKTGILTERKKKIKTVYDGYIYQIYAQYSLHLGLIIPNNFYCCRSIQLEPAEMLINNP